MIDIDIAGVAAAVFLIWKHWDTLGPKVAAVWASIKAWWNDGMAWLASMPARMAQAGAAIMAGLANGIRNGLGAARDAIVGAGDAVVGWFKEKLGIRSPSRVFMQLGGWVSEGAALGIAGKAPMVARAAAAMARFAPASTWSGVVMPRATVKPFVPRKAMSMQTSSRALRTHSPTAAPVRVRTRPPST